jgi:hypothetical protein
MGMYNTLYTTVRCPRCGNTSNMDIDCYFGRLDFIQYSIGDQVSWSEKDLWRGGGRPESGNHDGEGYTECAQCRKDFFVRVIIRDDTILAVVPDHSKEPLIPD